jgi:uncharacterized iron-regulated protein
MLISNIRINQNIRKASLLLLWVVLFGGCVVSPKQQLKIESISFDEGSIIKGESGQTVTFESMMSDLKSVDIVYAGERHNSPKHHEIQLRIIKKIHADFPDLIVGMEMFAKPYQPILNEWSAGELDETTFLKRVHWYANWKYDFALYREILTFIKENNIRLIGLNVPFHIPSKIAVGGVETLLEDDKKYLPKQIDTSITAHRDYVKGVFDHHHVKGRQDFENFYMAQCVWEDAMAESIAENLNRSKMVVIVGNGHIYRKFGIPQRAYNRTGRPFRTLYPVSVNGNAQLLDADYLWVTPATEKKRFHRFK